MFLSKGSNCEARASLRQLLGPVVRWMGEEPCHKVTVGKLCWVEPRQDAGAIVSSEDAHCSRRDVHALAVLME